MRVKDRRGVLKMLAASPILAARLSPSGAADEGAPAQASAADALDVFDLEQAARPKVPPAHWGYLQSGVDGERTLHANEAAFSRYQLKPKRFVDVSHIDLTTQVLGTAMSTPVYCCPIGGLMALHSDGEVGVARAAKTHGTMQVLSTQSSSSLADVTRARGGPVWYQLYTTNRFDATKQLLQHAQAAGCPVVCITVDLPAGRNTETAARLRREDKRECLECHAVDAKGNPRMDLSQEPMFIGIDTKGLGLTSATLGWDFIKQVKSVTTMKVVIKGLETEADARLAVENGADGIMVSNHGGRATETGRGTLESLPDVVRGVAGRVPVFLDGGVRRGTDVFKALALGASAVGIGRAYAWGLGAYGQAGVERALQILDQELRLAMVGCGVKSIKEITADSLIDTRSAAG